MLNHQSQHYGFSDPEDAIAALRRWSLLTPWDQREGTGKLYVLSPIRRFIQSTLSAEEPTVAEELLLHLFQDFTLQASALAEAHFGAGVGMTRFSQEFPNFVHLLDQANMRFKDNPQYCLWMAALASSLMVFCFLCSLNQRGAQIMRLGANAAIRAGDISMASSGLSQSLRNLDTALGIGISPAEGLG
jgi:hypothetical protein